MENAGRLIGKGNTANVYEWTDGKVLKLFHQSYPKDAIEKEFQNTRAIAHMNFSKPSAYEIIKYKQQMGIVYDRLDGELLLDMIFRTEDLLPCALYMANLHKKILQNSIKNIQSYKVFLKSNIMSTKTEEREKILLKLEDLPEGSSLCHGDFHPGNIIISNGKAIIIDFMNISSGHYLYDIARTVFLIQYTPVPADVTDKEKLLKVKKTLADLYLQKMSVTRDMIKEYLPVIIAARAGECPEEILDDILD
ncbi:MAG: phosphotransferase [Tissierellaceae bacterium]|nr:phosphotransferase [Tissierellaceae bacterium]